MTPSLRFRALALLFPLTLAVGFAQTPPPTQPDPAKPAADQKDAPKPEDKKDEDDADKPGALKKYEEIVTKDAVSQEGVFKVHRIDDKILFEIPANLLGRVFLWQTEVAQLPQNTGFPGTPVGTRVIRFTRRGNKIYMRNVGYAMRTDADGGIKTGVEANSLEPILMAFDVQTEGKDKSAVIDVTQLFTSDPQDFSVRSAVSGAGADPGRSYVDKVKAFPTNIETRSMLTLGAMPFAGVDSSSLTVLVHYSLDLLPEKPMMGRLKDSRIGYFTQDFTEYGRAENRAVFRQYINRFRLEKKDPTAAVSEPVKPIVFYLSREVPEKWRPYMKQAIEDWQPAFEQAGFKNAIIAKDAPTVEQDPDWDPEDARYSVIRWAPSPIANAMGPSVQDPRSGETVSAHVIVWNNVAELAENWYFSQTAAVDPAARKVPLNDKLMGELIRYVVVHEVGHTLGLEHNFKASSAYTVAQLRDPKFTAENGVSASIMDYSRFNYVAQPGDGVTRLIGMIGPYDKFAIEYGYKPIPAVNKPDDEKPALDTLLSKQVSDPRLRFGNYKFFQDPTTQTEDIGSDAVEATRLGLLNLDRIGANVLFDAGTKFGEDYSRLEELRGALIDQRLTELFHVIDLIGGVVETDYHAGRGGDVFTPVPAARQRAAARFLLTRGLETPKGLYEPRITNRIEPNGFLGELTSLQQIIFSSLLSNSRLQRMFDNQAANGTGAYTPEALLNDVTNNVWSDLGTASPKSDIYRRSLQRAYLRTMDGKVNTTTSSDFAALAKDNLKDLAKRIDKALPKVQDRMTALHLKESRASIEKILTDKYSKATGGGMSLYDLLFGINLRDVKKQGEPGCFTEAARIPRELLEEAGKE